MINLINASELSRVLNLNQSLYPSSEEILVKECTEFVNFTNFNEETPRLKFEWINFKNYFLLEGQLYKLIKSNNIINVDTLLKNQYLNAELQLSMYNYNKKEISICIIHSNNNNKSYSNFFVNDIDFINYKFDMLNIISKLHNRLLVLNLSSHAKKLNSPGVKRLRSSKVIVNSVAPISIDKHSFVSANKLKNFILNDPLCDWYDIYYTSKNSNFSSSNFSSSGENVLFSDGIEFEEKIVDNLRSKFPNDIVQIAHSVDDAFNINKYLETVKAIKSGMPIIYQGVLHNNINNTFGMPDLIVRSDFIDKIVKFIDSDYIDRSNQGVNSLGSHKIDEGKLIYYVIDIKNTTIFLNKESDYILHKTKLINFYKCQLCLYNYALGLIQQHIPQKAFILAKRYKNEHYGLEIKGNNYLAPVDFTNKDKKTIEVFNKSLKWVKYIRNNGQNWNPENPHILELLPNFKNIYDNKWSNSKKSLINNGVSDISELWMCSQFHRITAIKNNIINWRKQPMTPQDIGFEKTSKNYNVLNLMIKMNQSDKLFSRNFQHQQELTKLITPTKIKNNSNNWKTSNEEDIYLDFESVRYSECNYLFLIGLVHSVRGTQKYEYFRMGELTPDTELKNLMEFIKFIYEKLNTVGKSNVRVYHWGNYEQQVLNKLCAKYDIILPFNITYIDLLVLFKSEPIITRGALNFGLKSVATAFHKNGFISTIWNTNNPIISHDMMTYFNKLYNVEKNNKGEILSNILEYNSVDCIVMTEIVEHLRNNHI